MTAVVEPAAPFEEEPDGDATLIDCPVWFSDSLVGVAVETACGYRDEAETLDEAHELWSEHECDRWLN